MKKKVLAVAVASALVAPSAFAAQDTSGMHFTSASEGFYASIRARLDSNGGSDASTTGLDGNSSRFGVRGTNDLGGGLEGFYQYEAGVGIDNSGDDGLSTRLGNVGLRGAFGELVVGSFWANDYNWTHGSTDIANNYSGSLAYTDDRTGRTSRAVQYTSPDLNGFQAAVRLNFNNKKDNEPTTGTPEQRRLDVLEDPTVNETKNDVDIWNISAVYNVQGFTVAGSYNTIADGLVPTQQTVTGNPTQQATIRALNAAREDKNAWNARVGYAQDNWYVNAWYGEDNNSDTPGNTVEDDTEYVSIAGGVSVQKVNVYAVYDTMEEDGGMETNRGTVGVQYNIGAQSRVWVEYFARDTDGATDEEDTISVGLRHDF